MQRTKTDQARRWIQTGTDPIRWEYGRPHPIHPACDVLAYVEQEPSGYFQFKTYTDPHGWGAAPSRLEAQAAAEMQLDVIMDA